MADSPKLDKFRNARVLVIGDIMLDRYWFGRVDRISPEAPVPVIRLENVELKPGGAANVALNVASLGGIVEIVGSLGGDHEAIDLMSALEGQNIDTTGLLRFEDKRTCVKTRVVAHKQQVARVDLEESTELNQTESEQLLGVFRAKLGKADAVVVSDYAKGTLTTSVLENVIQDSRNAGKPVLVDPKGRDYTKYRGATILTPNKHEAAVACKLDERSPECVVQAGEILLKELGLSNVLITEGENGMTLFTEGNEPLHMTSNVRNVYDVTGAGDSVIACLAVGMAAGLSVEAACGLSNIAGGLSVQRFGTYAVTFDELVNAAEMEGLF